MEDHKTEVDDISLSSFRIEYGGWRSLAEPMGREEAGADGEDESTTSSSDDVESSSSTNSPADNQVLRENTPVPSIKSSLSLLEATHSAPLEYLQARTYNPYPAPHLDISRSVASRRRRLLCRSSAFKRRRLALASVNARALYAGTKYKAPRSGESSAGNEDVELESSLDSKTILAGTHLSSNSRRLYFLERYVEDRQTASTTSIVEAESSDTEKIDSHAELTLRALSSAASCAVVESRREDDDVEQKKVAGADGGLSDVDSTPSSTILQHNHQSDSEVVVIGISVEIQESLRSAQRDGAEDPQDQNIATGEEQEWNFMLKICDLA